MSEKWNQGGMMPMERHMEDQVLLRFLEEQHRKGMALSRESDILDLRPMGPSPVQNYLARFNCRGLIRDRSGRITESREHLVSIHFFDDYLRRCDPFSVLVWRDPANIWHPNILGQLKLICIGPVVPATELVDILYRVYEVITFNNNNPVERDALNTEACWWVRQNKIPFDLPLENRPLKRQPVALDVSLRLSSSGEGGDEQ